MFQHSLSFNLNYTNIEIFYGSIWNENNVKSSKVVSLSKYKNHLPHKHRKIENNNVQYKWLEGRGR